MIASPAESIKQPHGLDSHEGLDDLFSLTLNSTDWPENDTPHDILLEPRNEEKHETLEGGTKEDGGSGEAVRDSQPSVGARVETSAQLAPSEAHNTRQTLKRRRGREDVGGRGQSGKRRKNATNVPGPSRAGAEGGQSQKVSYKAGGPSRRADPMKRTRASAAVLAVRNA
ncbi:hypothetical protein H0H93_003233 [Arthromyces matolae]|nr:hypothetical protein H0H93_003233 [Arthromyces matolae]